MTCDFFFRPSKIIAVSKLRTITEYIVDVEAGVCKAIITLAHLGLWPRRSAHKNAERKQTLDVYVEQLRR